MIITSFAEKIAIKHPYHRRNISIYQKNKLAQSINAAFKGFGIMTIKES